MIVGLTKRINGQTRNFLAALALLGSAAQACAFAEIPIRDARDGAGPTHVFHLQGQVIGVIDPLDGKVLAYTLGAEGPPKVALLSPGARPWRLVRGDKSITVISEGNESLIEIPRDPATWPTTFDERKLQANDPLLELPRVIRNTSSRLTIAETATASDLSVRAIGPTYLASARELERSADGFRHVLWKEVRLTESPDVIKRRLRVDVYVGRYDKDSKLSKVAKIPRSDMGRIGFEYTTILPNGTLILLASLKKSKFKIMSVDFRDPPRAMDGMADAEPTTLIEPVNTTLISLDNDDIPVRRDEAVPAAQFFSRKAAKAAMLTYRSHSWELSKDGLRNPCKSKILPDGQLECEKPERHVVPPRHLRRDLPIKLTGLPYDWGGSDSIKRFDTKIKKGLVAGNIGGTFWKEDAPATTAGVDCSGLVSNVWKLGRHIPTADLDAVMAPVSRLSDLRTGDALLLAGHHVVLYQEQVVADGASLALRVTEAASRCGSVCESVYEIDQFHDYTLRRYQKAPAPRR